MLVRPNNCRNVLRDEGKPYPKSGCDHCKTGGITGCPFENNIVEDINRTLIDHYHIHGNDYDVYEIGPSKFEVWKTDRQGQTHEITMTPSPNTLSSIRQNLFSFAHSQLRAEYHGLQERALHAKMALDKLEGSVYNLEKFRQVI